MRKFLVLLSAFCMIAFVGCKKDELEPAAEEGGGTTFPEHAGEEMLATELEDYEADMFEQLFPYSEEEVAEMIAMFTDEELEEFMSLMPFLFEDEPIRRAKTRAGDGGGEIPTPLDVIGGVFDFVDVIQSELHTMDFINSGCTDEGAMMMALMCGKDESVLMLHQVLAQLSMMDQKLDHISSMVGKVNAKLTNQILNEGIDKIHKVIQDRNNRLSDVVENQRKYWRLMAMSIGMIDENGQKTPGYNAKNMLLLSNPAQTPKDSVTLKKDSLVRDRLELFHHYLTKWYKECENKGYRAEDLVKYMTRTNTGFSYPWTAAYSGVAITAVPWENESGSVVNALRAEDAAVLGVQVAMEALYCYTVRSKYSTGKNLPENLLRAEIGDIKDNLNILKNCYAKFDPMSESSMAPGARFRCTIPGCQMQFIVHDDVNKNVTYREKTFREIINEIGPRRYPGENFDGDRRNGDKDIEWYAMDEAKARWKAMNIHKDEFNRDTCEMLTLQELQMFNDYYENKARAAKAKEEKNKDGQAKDGDKRLYTTPFVEAVTKHIYPDDKNNKKRIWPEMTFVYPGQPWHSWGWQIYGSKASDYSSIKGDVPDPNGKVYSGYMDFVMYAIAYEFDPYPYSIHRCHFHQNMPEEYRLSRKLYYNRTNDDQQNAWQDECKTNIDWPYPGMTVNCRPGNSNCPNTFKNLEFKDIYHGDKHYSTDFRLPSPLIKRYDIRESIINATDAAFKAIQSTEQTEK